MRIVYFIFKLALFKFVTNKVLNGMSNLHEMSDSMLHYMTLCVADCDFKKNSCPSVSKNGYCRCLEMCPENKSLTVDNFTENLIVMPLSAKYPNQSFGRYESLALVKPFGNVSYDEAGPFASIDAGSLVNDNTGSLANSDSNTFTNNNTGSFANNTTTISSFATNDNGTFVNNDTGSLANNNANLLPDKHKVLKFHKHSYLDILLPNGFFYDNYNKPQRDGFMIAFWYKIYEKGFQPLLLFSSTNYYAFTNPVAYVHDNRDGRYIAFHLGI